MNGIRKASESSTIATGVVVILVAAGLIVIDSVHALRFMPELFGLMGTFLLAVAGKGGFDNYTQVKYQTTVEGSVNLPGPGRIKP